MKKQASATLSLFASALAIAACSDNQGPGAGDPLTGTMSNVPTTSPTGTMGVDGDAPATPPVATAPGGTPTTPSATPTTPGVPATPTDPTVPGNPADPATPMVPTPPAVVCDEAIIGGDAPNTLSVSVDGATHVIPNEIFGVLMEILGRDINGGLYVGPNSDIPNTNGLRNDIIQGFIDAGVGLVQWPGGCAANSYNWALNINPSNTMGTDLFMEFTQAIGAEPFITGRPTAADAQSNFDWVTYINDNPAHPEWNLRYFKVGNEVWGCGGNLGTQTAQYLPGFNANAALLSQPVNGKELFIVSAGAAIFNPDFLTFPQQLIAGAGGLAHGVEVHDYLFHPDDISNVGFSDNQYYDLLHESNEGQIRPNVERMVAALDAADPSGEFKLILDEWGIWTGDFGTGNGLFFQQNTTTHAVSAAEQLHVFMEHADRIGVAEVAQPINVIHSLFLTDPNDGTLVRTPTFYVFQMFLPHHRQNARWAPNNLGSEDITGNGQTFPVLSSGATVDDSGAVSISLANVDLINSRAIDITLDSSTTSYVVSSAEVITGPANDSFNDFGQPEVVNAQPLDPSEYEQCGRSLSVTVPSKSVVMVRLTPQ